MNLKKFLEALAESLHDVAEGENSSHKTRTDASSAAQALKEAANRVDPEIVVRAGDPD